MTTKEKMQRGRPRRFDPEDAVATAQVLFHAKGYDAVSVAELSQLLGINPPSFYAAFGSKFGLYSRVLARYEATRGLPLAEILHPDQPLDQALTQVLETAARHYAADPVLRGCMVLESLHAQDAEARGAGATCSAAAAQMIEARIAGSHPQQARPLTDFVVTMMAGLSAESRNGQDVERLLASARLAGKALTAALAG